ncbi:Gfo/Idh/MocA family oxidoreductase, partial [Verrucomicrobia bacterium]|nr:Gfo/Idh/MocA family oxidoreductase [Verrucomicrobiota bacterium]
KKISGGGILMDQGIHLLDLMKYLSGEKFTEFKSFVETSFWDIELEDNAFAIMKSENNVLASLHSTATQWRHKFLLEICLEEGYITLDGFLSTTNSYAPEKLVFGKREFEDITYAMGKPRETIVSFENDDSFKMEIEEFINAVDKGTKIINGTIDDAHEAMRLVEAIYSQ